MSSHVLRKSGKFILAQPGRRSARHLSLQQTSHGNQVVEEDHVVVVDKGDPEDCGVEQVPRVAALNRCPAALLNPNEPALLEQLQALSDR